MLATSVSSVAINKKITDETSLPIGSLIWLSSRSWTGSPFECDIVSAEDVSAMEGAIAYWEEAISLLENQVSA